MERRDFFKKAMTVAGSAAIGNTAIEAKEAVETVHPIDNQKFQTLLSLKKDHSSLTLTDLHYLSLQEKSLPQHLRPMTSSLYVGTYPSFLLTSTLKNSQ